MALPARRAARIPPAVAPRGEWVTMSVIIDHADTVPALTPSTSPRDWHASASLAPVALLLIVGGLALTGRDGLTTAEVVRAVLVVAWAMAGALLVTRRPLRALGLVALAGVAAAALACLADAALTTGWAGTPASVAELVLPLCVALLPATGLHLLLSLPHGRLGSRPRRFGAFVGYGIGVGMGLFLWSQRPSLPTWPLWLAGALALA
ncbi:MAG: hypothetical protein M3N68_02925, partial [Actinomycetota bacterium]|nr:hypothetical protein [Actinomycetota bacterium]